jgi:formylglycine-generating enzyme required for sulfatase activity
MDTSRFRVESVAWFDSDARTHTVGEKKPNAFGLYEMHGDVTHEF